MVRLDDLVAAILVGDPFVQQRRQVAGEDGEEGEREDAVQKWEHRFGNVVD